MITEVNPGFCKPIDKFDFLKNIWQVSKHNNMKPEFENIALHDNKADNRFEMKFENTLSLVEYEIDGDIISLLHTEVDPALEGRGAGTAIVEKVLEEIKKRGMQLIPLCPFVVAYIKRHPEWEEIIVPR